MEKENRGCPCLYLKEPCREGCTCVNMFSSVGCLNCCTYGSVEQRTGRAETINDGLLFYYKHVSSANIRLCVFCEMTCEDAPTKRGWSEVLKYDGNKYGLHFDCARKVAKNGDLIDKIEAEDFAIWEIKGSPRYDYGHKQHINGEKIVFRGSHEDVEREFKEKYKKYDLM